MLLVESHNGLLPDFVWEEYPRVAGAKHVLSHLHGGQRAAIVCTMKRWASLVWSFNSLIKIASQCTWHITYGLEERVLKYTDEEKERELHLVEFDVFRDIYTRAIAACRKLGRFEVYIRYLKHVDPWNDYGEFLLVSMGAVSNARTPERVEMVCSVPWFTPEYKDYVRSQLTDD